MLARDRVGLLVLFTSCVSPPAAFAQEKGKETKAGEQETADTSQEAEEAEAPKSSGDTGFYLRTSLGGGFSWHHAEETEAQPDLAMKALGGALSLHPGFQLAPGFAIHADVFTALNFAYQVTPEEESDEYSKKKIGLVTSTLGVGLTYHALPSDLFVSAGAGMSGAFGSQWKYLEEDGEAFILTDSAMTGVGYAAHGSVGKLFSVHDRWALGGSLNYNFQTFGRTEETSLSFKRAHTLWLGLSTSFHPAR